MSKQFYPLAVKKLNRETLDTVSVAFEIKEELKDTFQYKHGQYLTLRFTINGKEERRAYSMSSSPLEDNIMVTVKKVESGLVSTLINEQLEEGQIVEVMPPEGRFSIDLNPDLRRTFYLIGAGSGITPLMSIAKTILEEEAQSVIYLLYGNRNEESIIFKEVLDQMESKYEGQLKVEHVLSQPKKEKSKGIGGFFSKGKSTWEGKTGRIDEKALKKFLEDYPQRTKEAEYFICGPSGMMQTAEAFLKNKGVDHKNLHLEYFTPANAEGDNKVSGAVQGGDGMVKVDLDGEELSIQVPAGKSILRTLLDAKHDPPYSCTSGACSSCMAKVVSGEVKMEVCLALDDDEVAEGYILTCQAHPVTPEVHITFDI